MDAHEMRVISNKYNNQNLANQYENIKNRIRDAAEEGRYKILLSSDDITEENKNKLRGEGYYFISNQIGDFLSWE